MAARPRVRELAGILVGLLCLIWVFHDLKLSALREALRELSWIWILPAVALDLASYVTQAERWRRLLRPLGRLSLPRTTGAVYAGLFVNELLPFRAGELLRSFLVARRLGVETARVFPSVMVERFLDGIWLALAIGVTAAWVPLPHSLVRAGDILGVSVVLAALLLLLLARRAGRSAGPARGRLRSFLRAQSGGLRELAFSRGFWLAFFFTAWMLLLQGISFWFVLLAFGMSLSPWAALAVFLVIQLGTMIPNAPGNVGSYQFFCVVGLSLFGVEKAQAAAFSIVVFVVLTVPLWALGYLALRTSGLSLAEARRRLSGLRKAAGGEATGRTVDGRTLK